MQTLEAGTKKYLLIDQKRIDRNAERMKRGEPVVMVAEVCADGVIRLHRASNIEVKSTTMLEYSQQHPIKLGRELTTHAAFVTDGVVVLDPDAVDQPTPETTTPPTVKPPKAVSLKNSKE